jgi:hypothetical protein
MQHQCVGQHIETPLFVIFAKLNQSVKRIQMIAVTRFENHIELNSSLTNTRQDTTEIKELQIGIGPDNK